MSNRESSTCLNRNEESTTVSIFADSPVSFPLFIRFFSDANLHSLVTFSFQNKYLIFPFTVIQNLNFLFCHVDRKFKGRRLGLLFHSLILPPSFCGFAKSGSQSSRLFFVCLWKPCHQTNTSFLRNETYLHFLLLFELNTQTTPKSNESKIIHVFPTEIAGTRLAKNLGENIKVSFLFIF